MLGLFRTIGDLGGVGALARKAARNPRRARVALWRYLHSDWTRLVLGGEGPWASARAELARTGLLPRLETRLRDAFTQLGGGSIRGRSMVAGGVKTAHAEMLWAVMRLRRPRVVVETGVCNGLSSAVILEALALNGEGRLISIDLPEFSDPGLNDATFWEGKGGAVVPAGRPVGWLAAEAHRPIWRLELGRAQDLLVPLLSEHGPVDVFIHDSEHSYDNQLFEFTAGYGSLRSGGLLIATDINWSDAFDDFWATIRASGARCAFVDHACALVIKP